MLVEDLMEIHLHHAQSLGELILDGRHKPFRALACPLNQQARLRAEKETRHHKQVGQAAEPTRTRLANLILRDLSFGAGSSLSGGMSIKREHVA